MSETKQKIYRKSNEIGKQLNTNRKCKFFENKDIYVIPIYTFVAISTSRYPEIYFVLLAKSFCGSAIQLGRNNQIRSHVK